MRRRARWVKMTRSDEPVTAQLRLWHDQPITGSSLSVSGTIDHVGHKPAAPLGVLTSGVALVEYHVTQAVLGASKLGVGLTEREVVTVRKFFPMADQEAARAAIDAMGQAELDALRSPHADPTIPGHNGQPIRVPSL